MIKGIGKVLYESLIENKWLDVVYKQDTGNTFFWMAIKDVKDINNKILDCKIINYKTNNKIAIDASINIEKIISAKLIIGSFFKCSYKLLDDITNFPNKYYWFETQQFNDNVLKYICDCNEYDNDPYISEAYNITGLSYNDLNNPNYKLTDESMESFIELILKVNKEDAYEKLKKVEIGLSSLAININRRKYVVAYKELSIDFDSRSIKLATKSTINKSFLIDGKKCNLYNYLLCDPDEFIDNYDLNANMYKEQIRSNLGSNEKLDTNEEVFIINRDFVTDLTNVSNEIISMEETNSLTKPLRAYFGKNISRRKAKNKEPYIVIRDEQSNIDQIRVVYNTMTNYITYVEGPPGTGKTKTIVNVILSAMANNQTCIVCSNNNKPIDDIFESIKFVHSNGDNVLFPMIRIGNNEANKQAIKYIAELIPKVEALKNRRLNEELTQVSKEKGLAIFTELKSMLDDYEKKQELRENEIRLSKIGNVITNNEVKDDLMKELFAVKEELEKYKHITDDYVKQLVIPANKNEHYKNYLYYSSLFHIKKLSDKANVDLIEIVSMNDEEEALKQFNKYLSNDDNLKKFSSIFPVILTTNIAAGKLGNSTPHFDLCIMDEAGQCNIATSLIPIVRAKSLLLVGDINQLKPVIVLESNLNKKLLSKYDVPEEYNYIDNSILSLMKNKDKTSKFIRLRYHYRCPKKIIDFCNKSFYDGNLILENNNVANFKYYNVENQIISGVNNAYEQEAQAIVDIIRENNYNDVTIITPFKNQADLINKKLKENNLVNITAGTIHTVQGAEKNTIIFSAALCRKTGARTFNWIKNNQQLINVGVSRAKRDFIMVGDLKVIKGLDKGENSIVMQLANYVQSNGDISNVKPVISIRKNYSNDSLAEKELYDTLLPFFNYHSSLLLEKNIKVSDVLEIPSEEYIAYYHKAEFDFVISKKGTFGLKQPLLIIELDGGEHISCENTYRNDRKKEIMCNHNKIPLLRVPNSLSKDYDTLIRYLSQKLKVDKPRTLFDEFEE